MATKRRWLIVAFALAVSSLAATVAAPGPVRADRLDDETRSIAKELRCPVCAGETVADSNAELSVQMRGIIRQKLEAGESRDEIIDFFVARYGDQVLASPPPRGFTLGVWLAPIFVVLGGLALVYGVLRGWLVRRAGEPPPPDPPWARALPPPDEERLERELARFRRETARE